MNENQENNGVILPKNEPVLSYSPVRAPGQEWLIFGKNQPQKQQPSIKDHKRYTPSMDLNHDGKRIDPKYLWIEELDFDQYVETAALLPENKALLKRFLNDARLGKTIKKGAKKKIDRARLVKYVQDLRKLDAFFQKPLDQATCDDMERFITALEDGTLKSMKGTPFGKETQVCIKKIVIKFYKWLNGGHVAPEIVSWIDTCYKIKDYRAPKKEHIDTILSQMVGAETHRNRAIISVLFDGGLRADELLNLRNADVWKDGGVYWLRIQFSKTKKRTINLPLFTEHLERWNNNHPNRNNPEAQFLPISYTALLKMIKRAGNSAGFKLTPHSLRHGAATYWARHLSRYHLCARLGWAMSSKQPDRYIDQQGFDQAETVKVAEQSNIGKLSSENDDLRRQLSTLQEQMARLLEQDRRDLQSIIATVKAEIQQGK